MIEQDIERGTIRHSLAEARQRTVPIWVPSPDDPLGVEGHWEFVDYRSPDLEPKRAAQAWAVASLWATSLVA